VEGGAQELLRDDDAGGEEEIEGHDIGCPLGAAAILAGPTWDSPLLMVVSITPRSPDPRSPAKILLRL
jgi:hypothetical protein